MTQSERRILKRDVTAQLEGFAIEGLEFVGFSTEGAIFLEKEKDVYVVIKAIVKSDSFDSDFEMDEYDAKEKARKEREEKAAAKRKEKEEKAKDKE